jgi:hypothetical protein
VIHLPEIRRLFDAQMLREVVPVLEAPTLRFRAWRSWTGMRVRVWLCLMAIDMSSGVRPAAAELGECTSAWTKNGLQMHRLSDHRSIPHLDLTTGTPVQQSGPHRSEYHQFDPDNVMSAMRGVAQKRSTRWFSVR